MHFSQYMVPSDHIDKLEFAYQNTSFTINEYWSIGQVANLVNDNGANTINVMLTGDAVYARHNRCE